MTTSLDDKISDLERYIYERQLGIAEYLAREFEDECSESPLKQSGYAILAIIMPYFEMSQQFKTGTPSKNSSSAMFSDGFTDVYPTILPLMRVKQIYDWVRCGLYHDALTRNSTVLDRNSHSGFGHNAGNLIINPAQVVRDIRQHFANYICCLRNPCCSELRTNFETMYDQAAAGWITATGTPNPMAGYDS